jgi:hypothetical protein
LTVAGAVRVVRGTLFAVPVAPLSNPVTARGVKNFYRV